MSAPDTNVEKQEERHKPALGGIAFALIWGLVLLAGLIAFTILTGDDPVGADERIDGRTGEVEVVPTE
ncbi:MAG: hypothetical protein ACU0BS_10920 [Hasllibacter sp.]